MPNVILIDENDQITGEAGKMEAHEYGWLHRAVSVVIFNSQGQILLQQRADGKYHSSGLWTNTCCSHPAPGEDTAAAAARRLFEEMGFHSELTHSFQFIYEVKFDNGLIEHELDHVFTGYFDGLPQPDLEEVKAWKWIGMKDLLMDIELNPDKYTFWFRIMIEKGAQKYF